MGFQTIADLQPAPPTWSPSTDVALQAGGWSMGTKAHGCDRGDGSVGLSMSSTALRPLCAGATQSHV